MEVATLNLTLGAAQRGFRYRKRTNDEVVVVHALKNSAYNFGRLRRAKEISDLYGRLVQTGKTPLIVDGGANIGASTVYFACSFPAAHVVAIESESQHFELLTVNTSDLPVERLYAALAGSLTPHCVTIDEIYEKRPGSIPFIVKIDVDRCEEDLFAAPSAGWVARTPVIVVSLTDCLIPGTKNTRAFVEYIADCNRDLFYLQDSLFSIDRELVDRAEHVSMN